MYYLFADFRLGSGGTRCGFLALQPAKAKVLTHFIAPVLQSEAGFNHTCTQGFDGSGVGGVKKGHAHVDGGIEFLFTGFAQVVAHGYGDVAKVDFYRTGFYAAVAHGTVIGHAVQFIKMFQGNAAAGLLFVQEGFGKQTDTQNFIAR